MYPVSEAFKDAVKSRSPLVRPLIRFLDAPIIFTGEDIDGSAGLTVTEYANPDEDLSIGSATSAELRVTVFNKNGLLNDFEYGECSVSLGVRIFRDSWIRGDSQCTAILHFGTSDAVRIDGYSQSPFIKVNGEASDVQPKEGILALVVDENTVYGVYESGRVWIAVWNGSSLVELEDYTWGDLETTTWLQMEARRWSEYSPITDLNAFMRNKLRRWKGRGLVYSKEIVHEFLQGFVDTYEYVPLGIFCVDTPEKRLGQQVSITANDRMVKFDADATDWWNSLAFPIDVAQILQKVCARCNVPLATTGDFINSNREFNSAPFAASSITYRDIIKWIAEGAGSFARMSRLGSLELTWFEGQDVSTTTYFSDFEMAEYSVPTITGVQVVNAENDVGVLVGTRGSIYQIVDNPIFYGLEPQQVQEVAQPIQHRLNAFGSYHPVQLTTVGNWAVQAGDTVLVDSQNLPIFKNTITYNGGVRSTWQSTGGTTREVKSSESRQIYQQNRNIHQLNVNVKGIQSHLEDTNENVLDLKVFAEGITAEIVNSADNTSASFTLKSGNTILAAQSISLQGLVSFKALSTAGETTINGSNITTGVINADLITTGTLSADRIQGGTIDATSINVKNLNADNITSGSLGSARIADGAITSSKYSNFSIGSSAIGTDAIINRHIMSGSIYPSTCNDTINGYFADVIQAQKIFAGSAQATYMRAQYLYGDEFSIGSESSTGAITHTKVKLMDKSAATQVIGI